MKIPKAVLITGVAGFIGSNLAKELRKRFPKMTVVGVDNFSTGRRDAVPSDIIFFEGDVCRKEVVEKIFSDYKPEVIFHQAAIPRVVYSIEEPYLTGQNNIDGILNLLDQSRKSKHVKRFIFASSASIYGPKPTRPTKESENAPNPISPYAGQKVAGEMFSRIFSEIYGLDTISLRYFNVFGPGQYGNSAYATVISAWLTGMFMPKEKKAFIEGNGKQCKEYTFIENVVEANILALLSNKKFKGEAVNVAQGKNRTLIEVRKIIEKITGEKLVLEKRPPRIGDVKISLADISLAKKLLGYKPVTTFEDGLKKSIEWYKSLSTT